MTRLRDLRVEWEANAVLFGRLEPLEPLTRRGRVHWRCRCTCGQERVIDRTSLVSGQTKSCGCLNREHARGDAPGKRQLHRVYMRSASVRNIAFDLTYTQFCRLIGQVCYICGVEPSQRYLHGKGYEPVIYNGIDRLDNAVGYTHTNCRACCKFCNYLKRDRTLEEVLCYARRIAARHTHTGG